MPAQWFRGVDTNSKILRLGRPVYLEPLILLEFCLTNVIPLGHRWPRKSCYLFMRIIWFHISNLLRRLQYRKFGGSSIVAHTFATPNFQTCRAPCTLLYRHCGEFLWFRLLVTTALASCLTREKICGRCCCLTEPFQTCILWCGDIVYRSFGCRARLPCNHAESALCDAGMEAAAETRRLWLRGKTMILCFVASTANSGRREAYVYGSSDRAGPPCVVYPCVGRPLTPIPHDVISHYSVKLGTWVAIAEKGFKVRGQRSRS